MGGKRAATGRADVASRDEGPWLGLSAAPQGLGRATVAVGGPLGEERGLKASPPVSVSLLQLLEQVIAHFVDENHSLIL